MSAVFDEIIKLDDERWARNGDKYPVIFEVEHIGLFWEDVPSVKILFAPAEIRGVLSDHTPREMCERFELEKAGEALPLASGVYFAVFEFWFYDSYDFESNYDCDYGFHVSRLKRLRDVTSVTL